MKHFALHDFANHNNLLPLTFTRGIGELRVGILTIMEKWEIMLQQNGFHIVPEYLQKKYTPIPSGEILVIRAGVLPNTSLVEAIKNLGQNCVLIKNEQWIAGVISSDKLSYQEPDFSDYTPLEYHGNIQQIEFPWHIFQYNGEELASDFTLLQKDQASVKISETNTVIGNGRIFIHPTAKVEASILNTCNGDIYIDEDAEIMEGSLVRAPFYLGKHSALKMGSKIYGATSIGPHSKMGGELNNIVVQGFSNKAHDGFLGNSVIGEWCNIGADTNASNLKNNYAEVKVWNYAKERFIKTGLQFCGLIMGDHSKCGINTMFNTGTVVGVSANIFGSGFPRNFVPSFSWGGHAGFSTYKLEDAFKTTEQVFARREMTLNEIDKEILTHIFNATSKYRT